jgi:hypothetical protein
MTSTNLGEFEGEDVALANVKITNAGDGLSKALAVHPVLLHRGDKVHVVLECDVTDITFKAIKDTDVLTRVHTLRAGSATLIDEKAVRQALTATEEAIERARGVHKLPGLAATDGDPADDPGDVADRQNGEAPKAAKAAAKKAPAAKKAT